MTNPTSQMKFAQAQIIKNDIPVLLSKLILQGEEEQALKLLVDWGTHKKDNETIWQESKDLLENHS